MSSVLSVRSAGPGNAGSFSTGFLHGTAETLARRVPQGGHEVPIRKIVDRWARSIASAASMAAEVDRFYVYDNSVDDRDAQLVLRVADGRVVKAYGDARAWAGPILERLTPRDS
jgi:predicted ABC-type ATPase